MGRKGMGLTHRLGMAEQTRRHGSQIVDHGVSFNLWAPTARSVELLEIGQPPRKMPRDDDGWYQLLSPTAHVGTRYQFRINEDLPSRVDQLEGRRRDGRAP